MTNTNEVDPRLIDATRDIEILAHETQVACHMVRAQATKEYIDPERVVALYAKQLDIRDELSKLAKYNGENHLDIVEDPFTGIHEEAYIQAQIGEDV